MGRRGDHMRDLLDCIKSPSQAVTNAVGGAQVHVHGAHSNICMWLKRYMKWNPEKEEFTTTRMATGCVTWRSVSHGLLYRVWTNCNVGIRKRGKRPMSKSRFALGCSCCGGCLPALCSWSVGSWRRLLNRLAALVLPPAFEVTERPGSSPGTCKKASQPEHFAAIKHHRPEQPLMHNRRPWRRAWPAHRAGMPGASCRRTGGMPGGNAGRSRRPHAYQNEPRYPPNAASKEAVEKLVFTLQSPTATRMQKSDALRQLSVVGTKDICSPWWPRLLGRRGALPHGPLCTGAHSRRERGCGFREALARSKAGSCSVSSSASAYAAMPRP